MTTNTTGSNNPIAETILFDSINIRKLKISIIICKTMKFKGWEWIERKILPQGFLQTSDWVVLEEKNENIGAFINENKRAGKIFTSMSFSKDQNYAVDNTSNMKISWKRELLMQGRGRGVYVHCFSLAFSKEIHSGREGTLALKLKWLFLTGISGRSPHFRNIKDEECLGFAPDTEIYAFRVFTDAQFGDFNRSGAGPEIPQLIFLISGTVGSELLYFGDKGVLLEQISDFEGLVVVMAAMVSYTSWFLDAFNYAIATNMDVLNLSIGGPDYLDLPFVEKVWELTANNIIMVSAIGNDGPLYGRVKPDIVAYGREIMDQKISTGCKSLSGTSVASPVVAGIVCLLVSVIPENKRKDILNPASVKQALVEGAAKLLVLTYNEQGAGRVNLLESFEILMSYEPRASIFPVIFNATILNGIAVIGYVESPPTWHPLVRIRNLLSVHFTYSDVIWPWTGYLALHMQIKEEGAQFSGVIEGNITVKIYSPPAPGEKSRRSSTCVLQLKLKVVPTPQELCGYCGINFTVRYPPGYIPRDSLDVRNDILDWHGDHLAHKLPHNV
ncbi:Membrane-bound transcription factor site-1 protease [Datura stramonium]|uniref:Membrane-bound transcription factor site-1 protease n=1 Tax=Datura stramonium TaxID=4076 RepID=A0ABS8V222_DATST|nr:Membrane-bound transcription factor site-1 protease [Datura stramonium]